MSFHKPLKILVAHSVSNSRRGGMSRLMGFIHDEIERHGHSVHWLGSENIPAFWRGRLSRFYFPWMVWRHAVAAAKRGEPYDIVNVHEPSGVMITCAKALAGNPVVIAMSYGVEDRGWQVVREDARLGRAPLGLKTRLWHPLTLLPQSRFTLKHADHVVCSNEEDRNYLIDVLGIDKNCITRVFSGAAQEYIDVYPHRDYSLNDTIVFFGTWLVRKGYPDLVAAFSILATARPHLRLLIMGAGTSPQNILNCFPEIVRHRVEIIPAVTAKEYAQKMLQAAVNIIPSVFEGTPLTLMESMATGIPTVATATCGMKDVIKNGINGILVPTRDGTSLAAAVEKLLADRHLRESMGRQSNCDVISQYTWEKVAQPIIHLYEKVGLCRGECK